jgi:hypothetical protein
VEFADEGSRARFRLLRERVIVLRQAGKQNRSLHRTRARMCALSRNTFPGIEVGPYWANCAVRTCANGLVILLRGPVSTVILSRARASVEGVIAHQAKQGFSFPHVPHVGTSLTAHEGHPHVGNFSFSRLFQRGPHALFVVNCHVCMHL